MFIDFVQKIITSIVSAITSSITTNIFTRWYKEISEEQEISETAWRTEVREVRVRIWRIDRQRVKRLFLAHDFSVFMTTSEICAIADQLCSCSSPLLRNANNNLVTKTTDYKNHSDELRDMCKTGDQDRVERHFKKLYDETILLLDYMSNIVLMNQRSSFTQLCYDIRLGFVRNATIK